LVTKENKVRKVLNGRVNKNPRLISGQRHILFRKASPPNKIKIPFSFTFEIIFKIILNTDTRRCLVEPWASFMSINVISSIWRNLNKKKENLLALLADSNTEFQTSKWLCGIAGDIFYGPQKWRFFIAVFDAILHVEKIEKSLSRLCKKKMRNSVSL
jgi:hypothetical protein